MANTFIRFLRNLNTNLDVQAALSSSNYILKQGEPLVINSSYYYYLNNTNQHSFKFFIQQNNQNVQRPEFIGPYYGGHGIEVINDTTEHELGCINLDAQLSDLGDVSITSPTDGDVLYYSNSGWINHPLSNSAICTLRGSTGFVLGGYGENGSDDPSYDITITDDITPAKLNLAANTKLQYYENIVNGRTRNRLIVGNSTTDYSQLALKIKNRYHVIGSQGENANLSMLNCDDFVTLSGSVTSTDTLYHQLPTLGGLLLQHTMLTPTSVNYNAPLIASNKATYVPVVYSTHSSAGNLGSDNPSKLAVPITSATIANSIQTKSSLIADTTNNDVGINNVEKFFRDNVLSTYLVNTNLTFLLASGVASDYANINNSYTALIFQDDCATALQTLQEDTFTLSLPYVRNTDTSSESIHRLAISNDTGIDLTFTLDFATKPTNVYGSRVVVVKTDTTVEVIVKMLSNNDAVVTRSWSEDNITDPMLRTMNHEQLTDSTLGDINIHDGFYFPNAVQDYDGNWYGAVVIGDQVWMAENLKTTHYADGTPIADGTGYTTDATAYYYYPNQQSSNKDEFGLLYNYNAVMHGSVSNNNIPSGVQGISPTGWHVPSLAEFEKMLTYVGNQKRYKSLDDSNLTVNKAISTDKNLWSVSSNVNGFPTCLPQLNNKTFFGAKPAGMATGSNQYYFSESARFKTITIINNYYQSIAIQGATGQIDSYISGSGGGLYAESVRCVSDLTPVQFRNWYVETYGSMQHQLTDSFQPTLVSGTNIKTVNNQSLLGSGNVSIESDIFVCTYNSTNNTMDKTPQEIKTAYNSGKVVVCNYGDLMFYCIYASNTQIIFSLCLSSMTLSNSAIVGVSEVNVRYIMYSSSVDAWYYSSGKILQDKLVDSGNGQNIKTINNQSILGSGDLTVTPKQTASKLNISSSSFSMTYGSASSQTILLQIQDGVSNVSMTLDQDQLDKPNRIIIDNSGNTGDTYLTFTIKYNNVLVQKEIIAPALTAAGGYLLKAGDAMELEHISWNISGNYTGCLGLIFGSV